MLDSKWFRAQLDEAAQKLATRGYTLDVTLLRDLEQQRKALQIRTEQLRSERNQQAKAVGLAKAAGRDVAELVAQSEQYAQQLDEAELALNDVSSQLQEIMLTVIFLTKVRLLVEANRKIKKCVVGASRLFFPSHLKIMWI